jgi:hypothetical protein
MQDRDMNARLTQVALDIERHVSAAGWDQPPHLYALVETADLLSREPQLAAEIGLEGSQAAVAPGGLTPVDQGDLPAHDTLEELLAGISWPPEVLGTAIAVERLMLPPGEEPNLPAGEAEALEWVTGHPKREDVRLVVAVLRDGSRAAALRMRSHDDEQAVLSGPDLVPGLADALGATLAD